MTRSLMLFKLTASSIHRFPEVFEGSLSLEGLRDYYIRKKALRKAKIVENWMRIVRAVSITDVREGEYPGVLLEAMLNYTILFRQYEAAGTIKSARVIEIPGNNLIWVRREAPLLVVFDVVRRGLIKRFFEAASLKMFGTIDAISPLTFEKEDFESIESWVVNSKDKGFLRSAAFREVVLGGTYVREAMVKNIPLEKCDLYTEGKETCRKWLALSFNTPEIEEIGRRFSCRVSYEGIITLYSEEDNMIGIDALLSKLESILALGR